MTKFCKMSTQVNVYEVAAQHSHDKTLLLLLYYRTEKNMRNDETNNQQKCCFKPEEQPVCDPRTQGYRLP